jgi:hypothetical protein
VIKLLASLVLSLCFCLPSWAAKNVASVDANAIEQEIRNAVRDLQIQIPELLKDIRIKVQIPDLELQIPEINIQLPEMRIPETHLQGPVVVHIPEIRIPEIRIQIPKIDIQTRDLPK